MDRLTELKAQADELLGKMRAILDTADAEKRDLTPAEVVTYRGYEKDCDGVKEKCDRIKGLEKREEWAAEGDDKVHKVSFRKSPNSDGQAQAVTFSPIRRWREFFGHEPEVTHGFRNNGEWIQALHVNDHTKLQPLLRTMSTINGAEGGYAVPAQLWPTIWDPAVEISIVAPYVSSFPMTSNELDIPAWDSADQTKGVAAEIESEWLPELGTATRKTPKLRNLKFMAYKNALYIAASSESLMDSLALSRSLSPLMSRVLAFSWDQAVLMGSGVARPMGVFYCPASISVTAATASTIVFTDCTRMAGRMLPASQTKSIWVCSPSAYTVLLSMEVNSDSGFLAMQDNKILGKPVFCSEKLPALGSKGALMLLDLSYYALAMREEARFERSNAVQFLADAVDMRLITRGDGKGLLNRPVTPTGGGDTLSPFVILDV